MKTRFSVAACAAWVACMPSIAQAHLVDTRLGDFYGGALHPLSGFEFVLPWLALAILAALQGAKNGRWVFLIFPLGLMIGAELSAVVPDLTFVPLLNVIATASVGLLVALGMALPLPLFVLLSAVLALVGGYQNGQAMAVDTNHLLFIGGVTAIGYGFIALTSALMLAFLDGRGGWRPIALRAGGSWIAAVAIMVLGFELARVIHAG